MIIVVSYRFPSAELSRPTFNPIPVHRRLFFQSFAPFTRPAFPSPLFTRNFESHRNPLAPYFSSLAHLCSMIAFRHQTHFFPSFRSYFPTPSHDRQTRTREESQPSEAAVRRAYGVAENEDLYGGVVQRANAQRHEQALQNNVDGADYLKSVIGNHIQTLQSDKRAEFKKKIEESDPEVFIEVPRLAVKRAISSPAPLTKNDIPHFMHKNLEQLEQLRNRQRQLDAQVVWKQCCAIADRLSRETDCIASMQKAFQAFA